MFEDYQVLVLEDYRKKKVLGVLSMRLINPTPANLRDQCVAICKERFDKKDEKTLRDVFEQQSDKKGYLQAIESYPIDKFRPLLKFINGQITTPDERNVELLAWLIDFKPRPWHLDWTNDPSVHISQKEGGLQANSMVKEKDLLGEHRENVRLESTANLVESKSIKEQKKGVGKKKLTMTLLLILLLGGVGYIVYVKTIEYRVSQREGCMYWTGDQYERVPCSNKIDGTMVIAFDSSRLKNFRRITTPDTITHYSIGKVWYIKRNNKLEFYTAGGSHPEQMHLQLKPITSYIINTYLQN